MYKKNLIVIIILEYNIMLFYILFYVHLFRIRSMLNTFLTWNIEFIQVVKNTYSNP